MDFRLAGRIRGLDTLTRFAFHAAPACMLAYGVARLLDGLDGQHGPGPAWTIGHVFFLAALLLFGGVIVGLYRCVPAAAGAGPRTHGRHAGRAPRPGRPIAAAAAAVGLAGLLAFIRIAVIDVIVGLRAADAAEKRALARRYADVPALPKVLYEIGPVFFEVGLLALLLHLALGRPQRVSWWSLSLIAVGLIALILELDLLPVSAALVWLGLASIAPRPAAARHVERAEPHSRRGLHHTGEVVAERPPSR
ncbi:hypothetical protein GCM10010191_88350 [Actinomadura vinacea]|uniref:DUF4386 family protein n=1 Tax=Actinomadura vinacea TaxID=115336 RepID=A0ABN3KF65_9ACTN